jgi:hypothetical protein
VLAKISINKNLRTPPTLTKQIVAPPKTANAALKPMSAEFYTSAN